MSYLLGTNVWVTVLRRPTAGLAARFHAVSPADVRTCLVVVAELRHGCLCSSKPAANRAAVDALLAPAPAYLSMMPQPITSPRASDTWKPPAK
jgi:tRNA(fMet)-specific endonuclease VapC